MQRFRVHGLGLREWVRVECHKLGGSWRACFPLGGESWSRAEGRLSQNAQKNKTVGGIQVLDSSPPGAQPQPDLASGGSGSSFLKSKSSLLYIYTMEYYSAIKKNSFESVLMRWMKLEPIIQREVSQKDKDKYSILTHIYGI